jgi:hypothetical protein
MTTKLCACLAAFVPEVFVPVTPRMRSAAEATTPTALNAVVDVEVICSVTGLEDAAEAVSGIVAEASGLTAPEGEDTKAWVS